MHVNGAVRCAHEHVHLVSRVPKRLQLLHTVPCLQVRVVAGADRTHRRRLVTSVRLC
jgi:hypothetical protein